VMLGEVEKGSQWCGWGSVVALAAHLDAHAAS
jgi:hypothetical protein